MSGATEGAAGRQEPTTVRLRDGTEPTITMEMLERAAAQVSPLPTPSTDGPAELEVSGAVYDALGLLARALGVSEDQLRPRAAILALETLQRASPPSTSTGPDGPSQRPLPYEESWSTWPLNGDDDEDDEEDDEEDFVGTDISDDLTPEVWRRLQRLRGRWVAIRRGAVIDDDDTLGALLGRVRDKTATVLFVPLTDQTDA